MIWRGSLSTTHRALPFLVYSFTKWKAYYKFTSRGWSSSRFWVLNHWLSFQIRQQREKKKKSKEIVIIEIETHSCILKFSDLTLRFWFWCRDLVLWNNRVTCIGCYSWKDKVLFRLTGTRVHHYLLHPFSHICFLIYALCVSLPASVYLFWVLFEIQIQSST